MAARSPSHLPSSLLRFIDCFGQGLQGQPRGDVQTIDDRLFIIIDDDDYNFITFTDLISYFVPSFLLVVHVTKIFIAQPLELLVLQLTTTSITRTYLQAGFHSYYHASNTK